MYVALRRHGTRLASATNLRYALGMDELIEPPSNDNQRAARRGWPRLRDPEMIVALSAVLVGVCALAVSIYQSMLMREQQQVSVWPHIEIGREYRREAGDKRVFKLVVENTGIGPARLQTMRLTLDGKYQPDWATTIKALGLSEDNIQSRASLAGRVLLPGNSIPAVTINDDPGKSTLESDTSGATPRLDVEICYCSIYDRCYRVSYARQEDVAVGSCPRDLKIDFRE